MRLSLQHEGGEDVQDVDGSQPLKYALRAADAAIREMPPQGLVVVTSASQAWPLIAALRARDDIDVASARRNVDAALVVRRRNSHPPSLERLDLRTLTKLEWPPTPRSARDAGVASGSLSRRHGAVAATTVALAFMKGVALLARESTSSSRRRPLARELLRLS